MDRTTSTRQLKRTQITNTLASNINPNQKYPAMDGKMYKIEPAARGAPSTKWNRWFPSALYHVFEVEVNVKVADCSFDPLSHVCFIRNVFPQSVQLKNILKHQHLLTWRTTDESYPMPSNGANDITVVHICISISTIWDIAVKEILNSYKKKITDINILNVWSQQIYVLSRIYSLKSQTRSHSPPLKKYSRSSKKVIHVLVFYFPLSFVFHVILDLLQISQIPIYPKHGRGRDVSCWRGIFQHRIQLIQLKVADSWCSPPLYLNISPIFLFLSYRDNHHLEWDTIYLYLYIYTVKPASWHQAQENMNERCNLSQLNALFAEGQNAFTIGPKIGSTNLEAGLLLLILWSHFCVQNLAPALGPQNTNRNYSIRVASVLLPPQADSSTYQWYCTYIYI